MAAIRNSVLGEREAQPRQLSQARRVRHDPHAALIRQDLDREIVIPLQAYSLVWQVVGNLEFEDHRPFRYMWRFSTTMFFPGLRGFGASVSKFMCGPPP